MLSLVEKKRNELEKLNKKSTQALNLVTSTINKLEDINCSIESTLNDIRDAKASLQETEDGLLSTKEYNSKIAEKFRALIEG